MGSVTGRPPIWLLPRPLGSLPTLGAGHPRVAQLLAIAGLLALVPAYALTGSSARWSAGATLVVLLLFSFYAYSAAAHLRDTASLDATFVAALLGVVLLGPLPGALIFAAPELMRLATDWRATSIAANLASFGWACLAAAGALAALGYGAPAELGTTASYGAVAIAGLALILVNYFYITLVSAVVKDGMGIAFLARRELLPTLPVDLALIGAGAASAFLYTEVGLAGLVPLFALVALPRVLVPRLLRTIPVRDLEVAEATARYAEALADALGLGTRQRRVLRDAATHVSGHARVTRLAEFGAVLGTVLYAHERWTGEGGLGILHGDEIPLESRVLAVAHHWALLTARGGAGLSPEDGLLNLRARAGRELDPMVVAAAVRAVREEIVELGDPGPRAAPPAPPPPAPVLGSLRSG